MFYESEFYELINYLARGTFLCSNIDTTYCDISVYDGNKIDICSTYTVT